MCVYVAVRKEDASYLKSPDSFEQSEIGIFDDLSGFQSCVSEKKRLVSIIIILMRFQSISKGRGQSGDDLLLQADRNFVVMLVAMIPGLDMLGAGAGSSS